MPIEQSVEEFFPVSKSGKERDIIVGYIEDILKHGDKLATIKDKLSLGGLGFGDSKKAAEELNKQILSIAKAREVEAKASLAASKASKEQAAADAIRTKSLIEQEKELERLIKLEEKANAAKKANAEVPFTTNLNADGTVNEPTQGRTTGTTVSAENKAQVEGILTAKEYAVAQGGVVKSLNDNAAAAQIAIVTEKELQAARIATQKANSENNVALQGYKLQQQEANKAAKEEAALQLGIITPAQKASAKAAEDAANRYKQLVSQFNSAKDIALQYGTALGASHPVSIQLANDAKALGNQLKELEAGVGVTSRNVGNYKEDIEKAAKSTNTFVGAASKAFGAVRTLAYILPGLGIAGIFDLAIQGAIALYDLYRKGTNITAEAAAEAEKYKKSLEEITNSMGQEVGKVELLVGVLKNEKASRTERTNAIKELQQINPSYFGQLDIEKSKISDIEAAYRGYTSSIIQSIEARVKEKELTEIIQKRLAIQEQLNKVTRGTAAMQSKLGDDLVAEYNQFGRIFNLNRDERIKAGNLVVEFVKLLDKEKESVGSLSKNYSLLNSNIDKPETPKKVKTITDAVVELRKELAAIKENVKIGELAPKQADIDRVKAYDKAFTDIFKLGGTSQTSIVRELKVELSPINKRVIEQEIKDLVAKVSGKDRIDLLPPDASEQDRTLRNKIIKNTSEQIEKIQRLNDAGYAHDLENLKSYLDTGFITQKEYEDRVEFLKKQKQRSDIDNSISLDEALINNLKARSDKSKEATETIAKYEDDLNKLRAKLYELDAANNEKAEAKKLRDAEKYARAKAEVGKLEVQLALEGANLLETLVTATIENQIRAVEKLEESQKDNYDQQKERIQNSTLTQIQKDEAIKKLDNERKEQQKRNEQEERDLNNRRAKFERAAAVAKIIAETASNEVSALTYLSNPITAPLYPTIAALIAGIGAAQLATLLATPLPKYATGVINKQFDSFGIAGEAGPERVERPGYAPIVVDKETAMFMPRGTNVIPLGSDKINGAMYLGMMQQQAKKEGKNRQEELLQSIHAELRKKKPITNNFIVRDTATYQRQKQKYYGQA